MLQMPKTNTVMLKTNYDIGNTVFKMSLLLKINVVFNCYLTKNKIRAPQK